MICRQGNQLHVANVGDCAIALVKRNDTAPYEVETLTEVHRSSNPNEVKRITDLGGNFYGKKVEGVLAPTRRFGRSVQH